MMRRWRLFPKYATLIVSLVAGLLVISGGVGAYFSAQETEKHLSIVQDQIAKAAAIRIEQFVLNVENQMGWATLPVNDGRGNELEQRRITLYGLLRQVPAITEASWIDNAKRAKLRVSRLAMDRSGGNADLSSNPLVQAVAGGKTQFGNVYSLKDTEPYMSVVRPALGGGASIAVRFNLIAMPLYCQLIAAATSFGAAPELVILYVAYPGLTISIWEFS